MYVPGAAAERTVTITVTKEFPNGMVNEEGKVRMMSPADPLGGTNETTTENRTVTGCVNPLWIFNWYEPESPGKRVRLVEGGNMPIDPCALLSRTKKLAETIVRRITKTTYFLGISLFRKKGRWKDPVIGPPL